MTDRAMRLYCLISAIGIIIGETAFILSNDKYPPLWIDDYVVAASMLATVRFWDRPFTPAWVLANWAFLTGNIYAMLFARFEPINPPDRPWGILAAVLVWGVISTGLAAVHASRRASAMRPSTTDGVGHRTASGVACSADSRPTDVALVKGRGPR